MNRFSIGLFFLVIVSCLPCAASSVTVNLEQHWDSETVLKNPDKGWYHHYYDNSIDYYRAKTDGELDAIPNLDHLFIRLPWAYFEPQEGTYNWSLIDKVVEKWVPKGYKIALSFTCHETNLPFATPKWLYEMGVKGRFFKTGDCPEPVWEPDYDDPLFLKYLDRFLEQASERYSEAPWFIYISIGSIGQWGEGHSSGPNQPTANQVMEHLKLYLEHFGRVRIIANDDMLNAGKTPEERSMLHSFCVENKISYRDDSVFWEGNMNDPKSPFSIKNVDFFKDAWQYAPTILESCHFNYLVNKRYWIPPDGGDLVWNIYVGAVKITNATFVGYHDYAANFQSKNAKLVNYIANLAGYWFFPVKVVYPKTWQMNRPLEISLDIVNKGAARSYENYDIVARLDPVGGGDSYEYKTPSFSERWLPNIESRDNVYRLNAHSRPPAGKYTLRVGMRTGEGSFKERPIYWALKRELSVDGLYYIGEIDVE